MSPLFDHVVVLMLENRSFDHLFGYLGVGDGLPPGGAVNYLKPGDKTSTAFHSRQGGDFTAVGEGPSHSLKQTNEQLFGKTQVEASAPASNVKLDGFVASFRTSPGNPRSAGAAAPSGECPRARPRPACRRRPPSPAPPR